MPCTLLAPPAYILPHTAATRTYTSLLPPCVSNMSISWLVHQIHISPVWRQGYCIKHFLFKNKIDQTLRYCYHVEEQVRITQTSPAVEAGRHPGGHLIPALLKQGQLAGLVPSQALCIFKHGDSMASLGICSSVSSGNLSSCQSATSALCQSCFGLRLVRTIWGIFWHPAMLHSPSI